MIKKFACRGCHFSFELDNSIQSVQGELPPGLVHEGNLISGIPESKGTYTLLTIQDGNFSELVIVVMDKIFKGCYLQEHS